MANRAQRLIWSGRGDITSVGASRHRNQETEEDADQDLDGGIELLEFILTLQSSVELGVEVAKGGPDHEEGWPVDAHTEEERAVENRAAGA